MILRGIHTQHVAILLLVRWRGGRKHCWLGEGLDVLVWWVVVEDWFTLAGDEDICLFVDGDAIMSKNGNGAIITDRTDAHERLREVGKGIGC